MDASPSDSSSVDAPANDAPNEAASDAAADAALDAAAGAAADAATDAPGDAPADVTPTVVYASCKQALTADAAAPSGIYRIDPDGAGPLVALDLYCDMTFAGGGWTMIFSNLAGHALSNPGDAGMIQDASYPYYVQEPAPGNVGALRAPHMIALANDSTEAHIRSPFLADGGAGDAGWITSVMPGDGGPSHAIARLRAGLVANGGTDGGYVGL